jgi:hypothetical protein
MVEKRISRGLWLVNLYKRDLLEDLYVDRKIILQCISKGHDGRAWTGFSLAQTRDKWRAVVNTVMYFGFHKVSEFLEPVSF